jgi:hypothetical protein
MPQSVSFGSAPDVEGLLEFGFSSASALVGLPRNFRSGSGVRIFAIGFQNIKNSNISEISKSKNFINLKI